jgi:hypothetical protein
MNRPDESGPPEKAFTVNCEVGPDVQEALAEMREAGYRFGQLVMPNTTYGWVIGVRDAESEMLRARVAELEALVEPTVDLLRRCYVALKKPVDIEAHRGR